MVDEGGRYKYGILAGCGVHTGGGPQRCHGGSLERESETMTCELDDKACRIKQCFRCYKCGYTGSWCSAEHECGYCAGRHATSYCNNRDNSPTILQQKGDIPQNVIFSTKAATRLGARPAQHERRSGIESTRPNRSGCHITQSDGSRYPRRPLSRTILSLVPTASTGDTDSRPSSPVKSLVMKRPRTAFPEKETCKSWSTSAAS